MVWYFEGTGTDINFAVSERGILHAYGAATQSFHTSGPTYGVGAEQLYDVKGGTWSIYPPVSHGEFDGLDRGLWKFFESIQQQKAVVEESRPKPEFVDADRSLAEIIGDALRGGDDHCAAAGMIQFSSPFSEGIHRYEASVDGTAIFAEPAATSAMELLKLIYGRADQRFLLTFEFDGFRMPEVDPARFADGHAPPPTLAEFVDTDVFANRPYFSRGVSLMVGNVRGRPAVVPTSPPT